MNIIAIDIGNSSIDIGFFEEGRLLVQKIDTKPLQSPSALRTLINNFIKQKAIKIAFEGVIISSVVPGYTEIIKEACEGLSTKGSLICTHKLNTGINFQIKEVEKLGTDRIAAAVGANELHGAPVAVIDFGTATTLNFIGSGGIFKGGAIMSGVGLMKRSLARETAQLPDIEISLPLSPLGKDTIEGMLSSIIYGTAGSVERIVAEVEKTEKEAYKVVVTGGYSEFVTPFLKRIDSIEPNLVLKGLKFIYERNDPLRERKYPEEDL